MKACIAKENKHAHSASSYSSKPSFVVQTKLEVGQPNDTYEQEADAVAAKVMRMPDPDFVQRKCAKCEQEDKEKIQRKTITSVQSKSDGNTAINNTVASSIQFSKGKGASLDTTTNSFMSSRFGSDFSTVKIHTDGEAVQMNRELNAKAFTVGNDIYFNEGQYQPNSIEGKQLLAHELTHVVQQNKFGKMISAKYITCATRYKNLTDRIQDRENFETRLAGNIDSWTPYLIDKINPMVDEIFDTKDEIGWLGKIGDLVLGTITDLVEKALPIIGLHVLGALIDVCKDLYSSSSEDDLKTQKKLVSESTIKALVSYKDSELKNGKDYIKDEFEKMKKNNKDACWLKSQEMFNNIDDKFPRISETNFSKVADIAGGLVNKVMYLKSVFENFQSTGLLPSEQRQKQYEDCKRRYYPENGMPTQAQIDNASEKCYYLTFPYEYETEADTLVKQIKQ
ncbi:DUF4157 domain-containing protein [Ilyomonas limi]|uniref:DUF4157 domain-containing protein n=1 Tax=Ilyomonas limi TaxID=2575867 RepID=A0A4U3L7Q4_9BACT|nr:DUF4157 domain-containing protein [Ilyomonas limi]TKK69876.1 DUF4157 domain-containing protein [Ilyomonas limi]